MIPIQDVYTASLSRVYFRVNDYQPLLTSLGYEIIVQIDDDDYRGDSRLLFQDGTRYGFLTFGWGSCSGCDALQGCNTYEEVETLRTELHAQIHWEPDRLAALAYLDSHDWGGDWDISEKRTEYLNAVRPFLSAVDTV